MWASSIAWIADLSLRKTLLWHKDLELETKLLFGING